MKANKSVVQSLPNHEVRKCEKSVLLLGKSQCGQILWYHHRSAWLFVKHKNCSSSDSWRLEKL